MSWWEGKRGAQLELSFVVNLSRTNEGMNNFKLSMRMVPSGTAQKVYTQIFTINTQQSALSVP